MINKYPNTDFHELNLDWILKRIRQLEHSMSEFEAMNKITFDGAWDITKQYPAWCIVNDNGAGYISIQPVPAGMPLTNNDYWRGVVDYTATIADLQNRVVTLEGQMSTLNDTTIPAINNNITALDDRLSLIDKHKYIFIGDSYGVRTYNWIEDLVSAMGLTPDDYYSNARASYGFRGDPNVPDSEFINLLDELDGTITDKDSITDIVVIGGINDNYTPFDAGVLNAKGAAFFADANAKYRNAKIHVGFGGYSNNATYLYNFPNTIRCYKEISGNYNGVFIDNLWNAFHYAPWLDDDVHPGQLGMTALAQMIKQHLLGGGTGAGLAGTMTLKFTPAGIFSDCATQFDAHEFFDGVTGHLTLDHMTLMFNPGISHNFDDTVYQIGSIDSGYMTGSTPNWTPAHATAFDPTNMKVYPLDISLSLSAGNIYMMCHRKDNESTTDLSLSNMTQFVIFPVTIDIDGMRC